MRPANNDDNGTFLCEFNGRTLTLLGGLAHRVNETHLGRRKTFAQKLDQVPDSFNGLGGLSNNAEARAFAQLGDIFSSKDDLELGQVASHAPHFHMVALADNDGVAAGGDKLVQAAMGQVHERTGGFHDVKSLPPGFRNGAIRGTVGGDHDIARGDRSGVRFKTDALPSHIGEHGFVVNEVAQHGQWLMAGGFNGERDGVPDPKAHAQMFGAEDFHIYFVLQSD